VPATHRRRLGRGDARDDQADTSTRYRITRRGHNLLFEGIGRHSPFWSTGL